MSNRIFNQTEIKQLSKNKNVSKCSERSISYNKEFKIKAVRLYSEGMTSSEIFRQGGFLLEMIGRKKPKGCLRRWNKVYRTKGTAGLLIEARGRGGRGRPKKNNLTDSDKIKRLETEVAYLKAENDFLAKLRANKKR